MKIPSHIIVLTGAGISQSAGLPLAQKVMQRNATVLWAMQQAVQSTNPTKAHNALAKHSNISIITQNIDGLHQKAGSQNVVEYHGNLRHWYCPVCGSGFIPSTPILPMQMHCNVFARPRVVFFGEKIPPCAEFRAKELLKTCTLFIAIGTSGKVWPASSFAQKAKFNGAHTVLLNLDISSKARKLFDECYEGFADVLVPTYLEHLKR